MFRWEGGAAFMILELDSILTNYVRQLISCAYHIFPGTVHILDRERLTDHLLEFNTLHLFVH